MYRKLSMRSNQKDLDSLMQIEKLLLRTAQRYLMKYRIMAYKIVNETSSMGKEVAAQTNEEALNEITNARHKSNKISIFKIYMLFN